MDIDDLTAPDPWLTCLLGFIAACSVVTIGRLAVRYFRGQPLLLWELRRPVPWGSVGAALAVLFVALALSAVTLGTDNFDPNDANPEAVTTRDFAIRILGSALALILLTGLVTTAIAVAAQATNTDLGLPADARELKRDVRIGTVAWLAAIVPVYGLQAVLVQTVKQPSQHPLITTLIESPSPLLLITGFFSAVVVAPVCEEIAFRLLLQGWLEKCEDRWLANRDDLRALDDSAEELSVHEPTGRSLGGLPRGWLPILASSLLFAVAHVGHGPDPIALFLFALYLGYAYRRTHRIVPCVVAHALFNAMSLLALSLMIWQQSP